MKQKSLGAWFLALTIIGVASAEAHADYVIIAFLGESGQVEEQVVVHFPVTARPVAANGTPDTDPIQMGTPDTDPIVMGTPDGTPIVMGTPDSTPIVMGSPDGDPIVMGTPDTDPILMGTPDADPIVLGKRRD